MNKEFVLLNDGNMIVSNEKGELDKRYYSNSAQSELLSENKKELIENKLKEAKKQLEEDKKVKRFSTAMIKSQPVFVIVMTCGSFVLGGIKDLTNLQAALNNCFGYFLASSGVALTTTLFFSVIKGKYSDKIKSDNVRIDVIRKIKNDFEKDENRIKEHEYIRGGIYPNQVFNLSKGTQLIEENLDDQIDTQCEETLNNSGMKLSLRRK